MVSLVSLWLPILVSAVFVFIASSIIHMVIQYHNGDFKGLPDEGKVMDALRGFNIPRGEYMMPHAPDLKSSGTPEFQKKMQDGPWMMLNVFTGKSMNMAPSLIQWFIYSLIISLFAGYVASRAVAPGGDYLQVFRFVGAVSFVAYGMAHTHNSIWYGRKWSVTIKYYFDALVYALLTAGAFGWLWPQ